MAWVYMLRGSSGRYYIGSTTDLQRRMDQHRHGHTHSTKRLGEELELAAALEVATLEQARNEALEKPATRFVFVDGPAAHCVEQPRKLSGLVPGSNPGRSTTLTLKRARPTPKLREWHRK